MNQLELPRPPLQRLRRSQTRAKLIFLFLLLSLLQCLKLVERVQAQVTSPRQTNSISQPNQVNKQQTTTLGKQEQIRQKLFNLNEADENGIYLLGLFDVHSRTTTGTGGAQRSPFGCGPIDVNAAESSSRRPMQNMWAFLWAIDQVNQDESLLPGVKLGSLVLDTCSSELQTSQQLANLLHGHHEGHLPRAGQFAGLIADQRDWRSVEASASIASSLGLTTFVTQTRSTKLNEQQQQEDQMRPPMQPAADSPEAGASLGRLSKQMDERLLGGLLGIGNMMTSSNGPEAQSLRDLYGAASQAAGASPLSPPSPSDDRQELRLIKMLPGNEMLADALASLCDQMKWDLISVIYDATEPDLVDLHDELIRELFLRNTQLALDEQLLGGGASSSGASDPIGAAEDPYEKLLLALARKSQIGSRVVISLLSIKSARKVQAKLNELRAGKRLANDPELLKQLNSLQWITITDREPYYSHPTDSLGVISVSSSSSLMPEFKHYYDHLKLVDGAPTVASGQSGSNATNETSSEDLKQPYNKWWPEYMRAVMSRRREQLGELLADECAKWLEPAASPLNERCRNLDLASLADLERNPSTLRRRFAGHQVASGSSAPLRLVPPVDLRPNRDASRMAAPADGNKVARYLASGWDHNGMDVINSVLAIANGLESIRQTLCSNATNGLCSEMRQLIVANEANGILEETQDQSRRGQPTLSEFVHEELMKLTFQLVDGQMFRLNQSPYSATAAVAPDRQAASLQQRHNQAAAAAAAAAGDDLTLGLLASGFLPVAQEHSRSQLDCKLKFYNLRFLRPNSIGFVRFAQFSLEEGLTWQANQSQALHYSSIPTNFSDQTPIRDVKSTCLDATKCLMLPAFVGQPLGGKWSQSSASQLNEEQLAAGFNSLFKLDHPLIPAGQQHTGAGDGSALAQATSLEGTRTMRARAKYLSVPFSDPFQPAEMPAGESSASNQTQPAQPARRRKFEVIVLLPLHKPTAETASNLTTPPPGRHNYCDPSQMRSFRLDETHSFQQLAALAYAQQIASGHLPLPKSTNHANQFDSALTMTANSSLASSGFQVQQQQQQQQQQPRNQHQQAANELVISVIDYCGLFDSVEARLAALLRSRRAVKLDDQQLVAVVDFNPLVSQWVGQALAESESNLLHLTIARQQQPPLTDNPSDKRQFPPNQQQPQSPSRHVRVSLLPGKTKEIEAMLSLVKSFPSWRLLHLVYTDSHSYREEFVRLANEANICVSKLIWVPQVPDEDEGGGSHSATLEKTKQLFEQELFDFSRQDSNGKTRADPTDDSLNSTRLLVVLASSSDATNRLILEAASQSMLDDYVWLTSHEWLRSIELPFERAAASARGDSVAAQVAQALPKHFLSTKLESFESRHFKEYFSHLLPALHEPIPADWFDEFWQQHFKCRLPSSLVRGFGESTQDNRPECNYSQRLDWEQMRDEDDLVPYTIRAIESLQVALTGYDATNVDKDEEARFKDLVRDFKLAFDLGTRETVGNVAAPTRQGTAGDAQSLVGFHIVHRLRPTSAGARDQETLAARRTNSRQLPAGDSPIGQLVRVGLWRDHYQLKHGHKLVLAPFGKHRFKGAAKSTTRPEPADIHPLLADRGSVLSTLEAISGDGAPKQEATKLDESAEREFEMVAKSLDQLASIKSRCSTNRTCASCKRQIAVTLSVIAQEEAQLNLKKLPSEPRVFNGNSARFIDVNSWLSSLDGPASTNFDDDTDDEIGAAGEESNNRKARDKVAMKAERRLQGSDEIQAAASSLFDSRTSQQVASETRHAYRHFASHHPHSLGQSGGGLFAVLAVLSLIGVAFTVATMTYFYPNMLDSQANDKTLPANCPQWRRVKKFNQSQRSTSSSQCNIILDDDEELNKILGQMRPGSFIASILANIVDYLMLSALLMLYSINVAFLLPAAGLGICGFRRTGLALSYTLLFGSILAKIQEIHRRQRALRRNAASPQRSRDELALGDWDPNQMHMRGAASTKQGASHHQSLEPVEENVEVTFESLTYDSNNEPSLAQENAQGSGEQRQQPQQQQTATNPTRGPAPESSLLADPIQEPLEPAGSSLKLPLALTLVQLAGSLVWLVKQPPEPTLHHHSCWHCASLVRSPILFLYEPLLTLVGPALILAVGWLWSIVLFNRASTSDRQFVRAMKRLIVNQPLSFTQMQNPAYLRLKQRQLELGDLLRDSKLLVITTTLLVLLWASTTLNIVVLGPRLVAGYRSRVNSAGGVYKQYASQDIDDNSQTLVYTNILSGVIVFSVLFVYRLNWLFGCMAATKARKCHYDQISSTTAAGFAGAGSSGGVAAVAARRRPFRLFKGRRGSKTFLQSQQQHLKQDQTQANSLASSGQERLKLQHFSMTYGTYSATNSADGDGGGGSLAEQRDTHLHQTSPPTGGANPRPSKGGGGGGGPDHGQPSKSNNSSIKSRSIFKLRKPANGKGSTSSAKGAAAAAAAANGTAANGKLQRRQSNGSVASSQAKLMRRFSDFDLTDDDDVDELSISGQHQFDTISCAMSVASNSTSQLQGNDLYPIDCSIQLDSQLAGVAATATTTTPGPKTTTPTKSDGQDQHKQNLATVEL